MDLSSINLTELIMSVIGLIVAWVVKELSSFLRAQTQKLKEANKYAVLNKYIDITLSAVLDVVQVTNTTVVNDLKEAAIDGKLTDEEKDIILNNAVHEILSSLSDEVKDTISAIYGDLPTWIKLQINKAVENEKKGGTGISSSTIVEKKAVVPNG